jgi:glycosyltransferase involved in cell wall biosynthesis
MIPISILILTRNEERDLPECLKSVSWAEDVQILDSMSSDTTLDVAHTFNAKVTQRQFDNWASHQNWALKNMRFRYPWVLYLDADERVSESLKSSLQDALLSSDRPESAFRIQRRDFFVDGTWLKHAQISPYFIRIFRPDKIRYERLVNPITIVDGPTGHLPGYLDHYPFSKGIGFWMERHIKYADFEAQMIHTNNESLSLAKAFLSRDFNERRVHQKLLFYRLPLRPFVKFAYMNFFRLAFLDGRSGITYSLLQSIYEFLIVLKVKEYERSFSLTPQSELKPAHHR